MKIIEKYFSDLTPTQKQQFSELEALYTDWNSKINVISRKDINSIYTNHILHSLGIAKVIQFQAQSKILDVGTGGGFPGIPLAILFPEVQFHLVDSIGKKIKVVNEIVLALGLKNVEATHTRAEQINNKYDFIVSRAVTQMPVFVSWVKNKILKKSNHNLKNGILYLKGGDLSEELSSYTTIKLFNLSNYFEESFFETKAVVYLPLKAK